MRRRGWQAAELQHAVGVSRSTVRRWLGGQPPKTLGLARLKRALGITGEAAVGALIDLACAVNRDRGIRGYEHWKPMPGDCGLTGGDGPRFQGHSTTEGPES